QKYSKIIFQIYSNYYVNKQISVQQLEVLGGKIGSSDDGEQLRDQIAEVTSSANTLSKETNTLMKRLVELSNDQRYASAMRVHRERLMGDLIGVLNRLQVAQRNAVAKEKESMKAVAAQDQQVSHQVIMEIYLISNLTMAILHFKGLRHLIFS
ncbi:unnamed protein product, partial [Onchocerca flexuosa]|uniref:SynN domain-containing protein n=1 Tax=Onchocerca flexuosa TaxID=387005 RepID=A0A183HRD5_9BILA